MGNKSTDETIEKTKKQNCYKKCAFILALQIKEIKLWIELLSACRISVKAVIWTK